jgi:hypothetical protein
MMTNDIKPGIYAHYKNGNTYEVIGVAKHSETQEEMVVYVAQYGDCEMWVRPLKEFQQKVRVGREWVARFERVE